VKIISVFAMHSHNIGIGVVSMIVEAFARKRFLSQWILCGALGIVGLIAGSFLAQQRQPVLAVKATTYDFGQIEPNTDVKHSFEIKNVGGKPLEIKRVDISCGCITDAHVGTAILAPGKKTDLFVTWESPSYEKHIQEAITLQTNDPSQPSQQFVIEAQVKPLLSIMPGVINFGIVEETELPSAEEIIVKKTGDRGASDQIQFSAPNDDWQTKIDKTGANEWKLSLVLSPQVPLGPLVGEAVVTPSWGSPRKLVILGQVIGPVTAKPEEIYLDTSAPRVGTETILINSEKEKVVAVQILSLTASIEKVVQATATNNQVLVKYNLASPAAPQSAKGNILLKVSLDSGQTKRINVPVIIAN
jgi:hypothetical protein